MYDTWCSCARYIVVVVIVLTLTHRYNAVLGHKTGSNNSGAEDYLSGRKQIRLRSKKQKIVRAGPVKSPPDAHTITETNRTPQTKMKG